MNKKVTSKTNAADFDMDFLEPFLKAIENTFEIQCQTKVKILKPKIKNKRLPSIEIISFLPIISNGFFGSISLYFSEKIFIKIYNNMFSEKHTLLTSEIKDAAGEILNIIYGVAKAELSIKKYSFQKSFPNVITGKKLNIEKTTTRKIVTIPIQIESEKFYFELDFYG